jgi:hypothetical protein
LGGKNSVNVLLSFVFCIPICILYVSCHKRNAWLKVSVEVTVQH